MKNGKFETQAEIYQALLDGKKIKYFEGDVIYLQNGELNDKGWSFVHPSYWSPVPESRKTIKLYECIEDHGSYGLYDEDGRFPIFSDKELSKRAYFEASKRKTGRTILIDAETFEIVEEENANA